VIARPVRFLYSTQAGWGSATQSGRTVHQKLDVHRVGMARGNGHDERLIDAVHLFPGPAIEGVEVLIHVLNYSGGRGPGQTGFREAAGQWKESSGVRIQPPRRVGKLLQLPEQRRSHSVSWCLGSSLAPAAGHVGTPSVAVWPGYRLIAPRYYSQFGHVELMSYNSPDGPAQ